MNSGELRLVKATSNVIPPLAANTNDVIPAQAGILCEALGYRIPGSGLMN